MRPGLYTIPPHAAFLDALVPGLLNLAGPDPLDLARLTVLLPTRRAARALREAFLRHGDGKPLLLPRMMPVGDLEADEAEEIGAGLDLPPAISELRRRLLLTRLVQGWSAALGTAMLPGQAAALAGELARLLDAAEAEAGTLDPERLAALAPADHAEHWQRVLRFLDIVTREWPRILEAEACVDPAQRRELAVEARIAAWRTRPPEQPVVAAGLVGGLPAQDALIEAVLRLPQGFVVLPGFDRTVDEDMGAAIRTDPTHPQHRMMRLVETLGSEPAAVRSWPTSPEPVVGRTRLVAETMRPAATSDAWQRLPRLPRSAASGLVRLDCAGPQEEAGAIALVLRHCLEAPGRTAALVTPDRELARRVAAELRRWGVEIDDSAGAPLGKTPPGVFLRLVLEAADAMAPVALLAACKHPLAGAGADTDSFRRAVRRLERLALRGTRPSPGVEGLHAAAGEDAELHAAIGRIAAALEPLAAAMQQAEIALRDLVAAHVAAAEALAATHDETGAARLWAGDAGETAARFVAELAEAATAMPALAGRDYAALFEALVAGPVVRPAWGRHPRLAIWGLVEARLQRADVMVLGGLNEGTWPAEQSADPWMSRPMRRDLGLNPAEQRIGAAAHDFAQALAAPVVYLTRAGRVEGAETVPSRWLLRLDTVLLAAGLSLDDAAAILDWQALLDRPARRIEIGPPAPRPPVEARPRQLSATRIEKWRRDPYAIYAERILRLKKLDGLEEDPGAADFGNAIHAALEAFFTAHPAALPADALVRLTEEGRRAFGSWLSRPAVWAFWWPRFERIARWLIEHEQQRRVHTRMLGSEVDGALVIDAPHGPFTLTAKADRIDRVPGGLGVLDYKTGATPKGKAIELGYAPQLPLEAAIASAGGFTGIAAEPVALLAYWRLSGFDPPGEECVIAEGAEATRLVDAAVAGLRELVARFDDPGTPYLAEPHPGWRPYWNDYAQLARVKEWSLGREIS